MCIECERKALEAAKGLNNLVPGAMIDESIAADELYRKIVQDCPKKVSTYEELSRLHGCEWLHPLKPEEDGTDCCCAAELYRGLAPNCHVNNPCDLLRQLCYCPNYQGFWERETVEGKYVLVDTRNSTST